MLLGILGGFLALLYFRVYVSTRTINCKTSCAFFCTPLMHRWPINTKWNDFIIGNNKTCLVFIFIFFSFYRNINTNSNEQRVYMGGLSACHLLALETDTFWQRWHKLFYKIWVGLEPAQIQHAGNSFCVPLGIVRMMTPSISSTC